MTRLKLFAFYFLMSLAALVNPKEAQKMIDCANEGSAERARKNARDHFRKLIKPASNREGGQG